MVYKSLFIYYYFFTSESRVGTMPFDEKLIPLPWHSNCSNTDNKTCLYCASHLLPPVQTLTLFPTGSKRTTICQILHYYLSKGIDGKYIQLIGVVWICDFFFTRLPKNIATTYAVLSTFFPVIRRRASR